MNAPVAGLARKRAMAPGRRTIRRLAAETITALTLGASAAGAQTAAQPPAAELALLRCSEGASRPCAALSVELSPDQITRASRLGADSLAAAFRARFMGDTGLLARARRGGAESPRDNRLLILVDVSGTMKNLGIGTVRLALQDLLATFDSLPAGAVRIAVAPFGSVQVASRIGAAAFTTPDSARLAVDVLPTPDRENTGLFSAVEAGMARLGAELKASAAPGVGVLMVITDGTDNDVGHPGDDPGLLAGAEGLQRAARAVDQSGMIAAIIGIGAADQGALGALAGSRGRKYLVRLDAYQLAAAFREIRDLFWSSWDVIVPLSGSRENLGRGVAALTASLALGAESGAVGTAFWRPPLVALPAFAGVAPASLVPVGTTDGAGGFVLDRRIPLASMVLVLLGMLWFVVPRLLWPPVGPAPAAAAPAAKAAKAAPVAAGGLRTDVKEIGPRRPTDITAARATRAR